MTTTITQTKPLRIENTTKRRRQNPYKTRPVSNLVLDPLPVLFLPLSLSPLFVLRSSKVHPPFHGFLSFSGLRVRSAAPRRCRHGGRGTRGCGHPCRVGLSLRRPEEQAGSGNGGGGEGAEAPVSKKQNCYLPVLRQLRRNEGERLKKASCRCCLRYSPYTLGRRFFLYTFVNP